MSEVLYKFFLRNYVVFVCIQLLDEKLHLLYRTVLQNTTELIYLQETCLVPVEVVEGLPQGIFQEEVLSLGHRHQELVEVYLS